MATSLMTIHWFDATEEAVCPSASDKGLVVGGIRETLRMLLAKWASEMQLANTVSRDCLGNLGQSTMGIASFTSRLFFNHADSSMQNLTSVFDFLCAWLGCCSPN